MTFSRIYIPANETSNARNAIADKRVTRKQMASFYADLIVCANIHGRDTIDFAAINAAIVKRWPKGLTFIKTLAWRELEGTLHA